MLGLGDIRKMCTPAVIYFFISLFSLLTMIGMNFSNHGSNTTLCVGNYDCPTDNLIMVYLVKAMYILFMTIVLDSLCKNGFSTISWLLVFFPLLMYFIILGFYMIYQNSKTIKHSETIYMIN
jgi:predicted permease